MPAPSDPNVSRRTLLAIAASVPLTTSIGFADERRHSNAPRQIVIVGDSQLDNAMNWSEIITELARNDTLPGMLPRSEPDDHEFIRELPRRIPDDTSNLVLAAGREELRRLEQSPSSVTDTFTRLSTIGQQFASYYSPLLEAALATGIPLTVCTLMGERNADPFQRRIADVPLAIANDAITREASRHQLPMLDLRLIGRSATPHEIATSLLKVLSPG
ncbi:MAG: hypothetical protein WDZ83_17770 [Rhizobiaceae bacterium]